MTCQLVVELPPWQIWWGEWNVNATLGGGKLWVRYSLWARLSVTLPRLREMFVSGVGCLVSAPWVFACVQSSNWQEHNSFYSKSIIVCYFIKKVHGASVDSPIHEWSPLVALAVKTHSKVLFDGSKKHWGWIYTQWRCGYRSYRCQWRLLIYNKDAGSSVFSALSTTPNVYTIITEPWMSYKKSRKKTNMNPQTLAAAVQVHN